jgi:hypothetical protein
MNQKHENTWATKASAKVQRKGLSLEVEYH